MATTITSIKCATLLGITYATITKSDGSGIYARCIRNNDHEIIIWFAGKLISISIPDYKCEVLCEGVSIR